MPDEGSTISQMRGMIGAYNVPQQRKVLKSIIGELSKTYDPKRGATLFGQHVTPEQIQRLENVFNPRTEQDPSGYHQLYGFGPGKRSPAEVADTLDTEAMGAILEMLNQRVPQEAI